MKSTILSCAMVLTLALGALSAAYADSATWNLNPPTGDWNTAANWTPATVPNGRADTATFDVSNITDVTVSASTTVDGILFNPGASSFTITASSMRLLTFNNTGIVNNSGVLQTFVSPSTYPIGSISFHTQATAGSDTFFDNLADSIGTGNVEFFDHSNAGTATFMNHGLNGSLGGSTFFWDHSSAAQGTFINTGAPAGTVGGVTVFFSGSTAADATIINKGGLFPSLGGGYVEVFTGANAGNATIIAEGGTGAGTEGGFIEFFGGNPANATVIAYGGIDGGEGGMIGFDLSVSVTSSARVELLGNSLMYFPQDPVRIELGSIEGGGNIDLNEEGELVVGNNNLSTIFSGVISKSGSFTKVGEGTLTLRGANTYTGGTTIEGGKLVVNNRSGSGTGSGAVQVNAGILAGRGTIAGAVTVGSGSGAGAALAPGRRGAKADTLTILSALTFQLDSTYKFELKASTGAADKVIANGVTINTGALVAVIALDSGTLPQGTVLTAISNTSANPISGTFSNLPDGGIVTINGNNLQASYSGGDGNDLTLTVVP